MANITIKVGYKTAAFFTANPTLVLAIGQLIYLEQTGTYKIGDGVTQLSVLAFKGSSSQTLAQTLANGAKTNAIPITSDTSIDIVATDTFNIVSNNSQGFVSAGTILNLDGYNNVIITAQINAIDLNAPSVKKNGFEVETQNNKGIANGYAPLDASAKIASAYLPAYVDDVLEFANLAALPITGTSGIIYITIDTNFEYRWSGTTYIRLVASPGTTDALTEGVTNLYFTVARAISALTGQANTLFANAANYLVGNTAIVGATKTKVTYDSKGLVTSGADATTADIADSLNKRYVTDAQLVVVGNTSNTNTGDNATNTQYSGLAASKQNTLVSGTNIKTINSQSLLGSGDIQISSVGSKLYTYNNFN